MWNVVDCWYIMDYLWKDGDDNNNNNNNNNSSSGHDALDLSSRKINQINSSIIDGLKFVCFFSCFFFKSAILSIESFDLVRHWFGRCIDPLVWRGARATDDNWTRSAFCLTQGLVQSSFVEDCTVLQTSTLVVIVVLVLVFVLVLKVDYY